MKKKYKRVAAALLWVLFLGHTAYAQTADARFCPEGDAPLYLHSVLPVIKNANIKDFVETNQLNRFGTIVDLVDLGNAIAASMPAGGAQGVTDLLSFYDNFFNYMIKNSDQGIDGYISSKILSEIEALHYLKQIKKRRVVLRRTDTLPEDAYRYSIIGSYSYINNGNVMISVVVRNINTGEQRAFSSSGKIEDASKRIAQEVFDLFYLPEPPVFLNPFAGSKLIEISSDSFKNRIDHRFAEQICETQNARIISRQELKLAASLGKYISGVDIDVSDFYTVTDPKDGLMRLLPATDECYKTRPNEKALTRLICVRDN
jgi:hypothetical protein